MLYLIHTLGLHHGNEQVDQLVRGERRMEFFNLPQKCTIRIFNVRGELIDIIEHEGVR